MAQPKEHDVEAQLSALVDIFIEGITPEEAQAILDAGPSALQSACFAWAFAAADEIEGHPAVDPTSARSLMQHAPLVNRLRELGFEAFCRRFGVPKMPTLPDRPSGASVHVRTEQDGADHRRMSKWARVLCHRVVGGMGSSWAESYYITRNHDRTEFLLWIDWEDGESWRHFTTEHARMGAVKGLSERDAALILLEAYWTAMRNEWEQERPNELSALGKTITHDEVGLIADRVWPRD